MGKPEGKGLLRRPRHRWKGTIKHLKERSRMGWSGLIWLRIGTSGGLLRTQ
jgi:hypothetical protein